MKYKLIPSTRVVHDVKLQQLVYIKPNGLVPVGVRGGYVESENNLSQDGNCWIMDNACCIGEAVVSGNAKVKGSAIVSERAIVTDSATVSDNAEIANLSIIGGNCVVSDNAFVRGKSKLSGHAKAINNTILVSTTIGDSVVIRGNERIVGDPIIVEGFDKSIIFGGSFLTIDTHQQNRDFWFNSEKKDFKFYGFEYLWDWWVENKKEILALEPKQK